MKFIETWPNVCYVIFLALVAWCGGIAICRGWWIIAIPLGVIMLSLLYEAYSFDKRTR